jgi:hypothetical protein
MDTPNTFSAILPRIVQCRAPPMRNGGHAVRAHVDEESGPQHWCTALDFFANTPAVIRGHHRSQSRSSFTSECKSPMATLSSHSPLGFSSPKVLAHGGGHGDGKEVFQGLWCPLSVCSVIPNTHGLDGIGKKLRRSLTCLGFKPIQSHSIHMD